MCKPLGEIAVDEIRIKLHLTQSINYISCIFPPKGPTDILETILHNFLGKIYEACISIFTQQFTFMIQQLRTPFPMKLAPTLSLPFTTYRLLSRLLMYFGIIQFKQYGLRSCSLIRLHSVCFHVKTSLKS